MLFLLYENERNSLERENQWGLIEEKLNIRSMDPTFVQDEILNNSDVIITHRIEYNSNIKNRLNNTHSLVVVFSGGVSGINRDIYRENTLWVQFPTGIEKIASFVINLINNKDTLNYQSAIEALVQSYLNKQPHYLIALSILCQGYLASHGGDGLEGWDKNKLGSLTKIVESKEEVTKMPAYWNIFSGAEKHRLEDEFKDIVESNALIKDDEKKALDTLIKLISLTNKIEDKKIVKEAYVGLRKIF